MNKKIRTNEKQLSMIFIYDFSKTNKYKNINRETTNEDEIKKIKERMRKKLVQKGLLREV